MFPTSGGIQPASSFATQKEVSEACQFAEFAWNRSSQTVVQAG